MILGILIGLLILLVGYFWWRERCYLKKKTSEIMSPSVWSEIVAEREEVLRKRRAFQEALKGARDKEKKDVNV